MGMQWKDGYSTQVRLYLLVEGEQLRIAKIGSENFVLRDQLAIPASTHAQLQIDVDGITELQDVFLPQGSRGTNEPVQYEAKGPSPAVAAWCTDGT